MSEVYFPVINNSDGKISVAFDFNYEVERYNFFPNEQGQAYLFTSEEEAEAWINTYIKEELRETPLASRNAIRLQYLKEK